MLGFDFHNFWNIGRAVLAGLSPYSVPDSFYPPATAYLFGLLGLLPFNLSFGLWTGVNVILFQRSILRVQKGWSQIAWLAFAPVTFILLTGQIDILFLWLAGFLGSKGWKAVLAGVLITLKHALPLLADPLIYQKWLASAGGESSWRLPASPGVFALTNLNIPLILIGILAAAIILSGLLLLHDAMFSKTAQLLALPAGLWYENVFVVGSTPWWMLVPISWLAFWAALQAHNNYPFVIIPLVSIVWQWVHRSEKIVQAQALPGTA
jgi:hypothetical protein